LSVCFENARQRFRRTHDQADTCRNVAGECAAFYELGLSLPLGLLGRRAGHCDSAESEAANCRADQDVTESFNH
jgi:hypothetical protein